MYDVNYHKMKKREGLPITFANGVGIGLISQVFADIIFSLISYFNLLAYHILLVISVTRESTKVYILVTRPANRTTTNTITAAARTVARTVPMFLFIE